MTSQETRGNILLVANYASDIGYAWWLMETYWVEIAKYFHKKGRKIFLCYPKIRSISSSIKNAPLQLLEHDYANRTKPSVHHLRKIIEDNNIRSIYLTDQNIFDRMYFLMRTWGVKRIVMHDHAPGERPQLPLFSKALKRMLHFLRIFSCHHYIGVSRFVYSRFLSNGCIPENMCSYVVNGVQIITIEKKNRHLLHQMFDLPEEAVIVVTTGRATYYKGIDFIIRCAKNIVHDRGESGIYFVHCGDGPDLNDFKELVAELELGKVFFFAGRVSNVMELLQSAQIGIQASKGEAFSLSILEYMSAGLATLAPDHCGNNEAISNGMDGFLYPPGNIDEVTERIILLAHDEHYRKKIGSAALKKIHSHLNITRANTDFRNTIANLL